MNCGVYRGVDGPFLTLGGDNGMIAHCALICGMCVFLLCSLLQHPLLITLYLEGLTAENAEDGYPSMTGRMSVSMFFFRGLVCIP